MGTHGNGWSRQIDDDTGEMYIHLGDDHQGFTRYVWFGGDMEGYEPEDFQAANKMAAAPDLHKAAKDFLAVLEAYEPEIAKSKWGRALREAVEKAEGNA